MNSYEKDCVLVWDEMRIKSQIAYDRRTDSLLGIHDLGNGRRKLKPAKYALVFIVKGLNTNWEYPLSLYFSEEAVQADELYDLVRENVDAIIKLGLRLRITTCDQGKPGKPGKR